MWPRCCRWGCAGYPSAARISVVLKRSSGGNAGLIRKGVKAFQEPYAYQFVDLDTVEPVESRRFYPMVLPVCRRYVERRYRLLQLFYDALLENTLTGIPICRSMILTD